MSSTPPLRTRSLPASGSPATALAIVVLAIGALTLSPSSSTSPSQGWCLICGPLGAIDFTGNVALFVPFGAAALRFRRRLSWVVAAGALFSAGIESLQWQLIPGRDASIGDFVANTLGSFLGASLMFAGPSLHRPKRSAAAFQWKALAVFMMLLSATSAWLLAPARPAYTYWSQWAPSRTGYSTFKGTLESLQLFGEEIPNGTIIDPTTRPPAYARGDLGISGRVVAGPSDSKRALIARAGNPLGEHFQLGQHRQSLVFRPRVNAARLGFRSPSLDLGSALTPGIHDFELTLDHRRARLRMDDGVGARDRVAGITVGYIWQVASPFEIWSRAPHVFVAGTLFALVFAVLAYWESLAYRSGQVFGSMTVGAVSLLAIPLLLRMPVNGWAELLGSLFGIAVGAVLARRAASG